jgi:hypothetical protein
LFRARSTKAECPKQSAQSSAAKAAFCCDFVNTLLRGGFHGGRGGFRGGFHGGGRGGFRGGGSGGGRRSDFRLKHEIILLGHLNNGLGFYRFVYNGGEKAYVGVIAQEVKRVIPQAVVRGRDDYLRVFYNKVGLKFQTYGSSFEKQNLNADDEATA